MRPDIFKGLTPKLKDYFGNFIITCLFHLSKEIHGKGRNSAYRRLAEDQDRPKGQILQGYQVGKGEESEEKDFRGSFLS